MAKYGQEAIVSRSNDQIESLTLLKGGHLPEPKNGPEAGLLETFKSCTRKRFYVVTLDFPEFTSLCPVTGQPDFGRIFVEYIPDELCVETKSFKLYMYAYRNHHSFMETMTNTILDDLCSAMHPLWCRVQGLFAVRGGTRLSVYAEDFKSLDAQTEKKVRDFVAAYRSDVHIDRGTIQDVR
ncbi:MAG: NADPH-dependent 7-cyano-7-deazaguanine reductase QueF [Desulfovibrionaceae bacterium]|nr:NADPH-dependent 7-cyano-7-deazaguanine reductase QueF [Desulfovibrionaceae bacterium]